MFSDGDDIICLQDPPGNFILINKRAIGTVQVLDNIVTAILHDSRMMGGNRHIIDLDIIGSNSPNCDFGFLRLDFTKDGIFKLK